MAFGVQEISFKGWVTELSDQQLLIYEAGAATQNPDIFWEKYETFEYQGNPAGYRQYRDVNKNGPNGSWVESYWTEILIAKEGKVIYIYIYDEDVMKSNGVAEYSAEFLPDEIAGKFFNSFRFL
jgi:hypothetical protein